MQNCCLFLLTLSTLRTIIEAHGIGPNNASVQCESKFRHKRFLFYENGGLLKIVIGFSLPVILDDRKSWRSLAIGYALQGQFAVPTQASTWWQKWDSRTLADAKMQYNRDGTYVADESRRFLYAIIEFYVNRTGRNGKCCLLREICESAVQGTAGEGVFADILKIVLTPGKDSDKDYQDAYKAGSYGANCETIYPECPYGQGILDGFLTSRIED